MTRGVKSNKVNKLIYCACGCGQQRKKYDKKGVPRYYIYGHVGKYPKGSRTCKECGSNTTHERKRGDKYTEEWYNVEGGIICRKCRDKKRDRRKNKGLSSST